MGNPRVLRPLQRRLKKAAPQAPVPDVEGMRRAVRDFLRAAGVDLTEPNLLHTPERVAEAWAREFLDGYAVTPEQALGESYPAPAGAAGELVVVTQLRFHSMCPHHLLPVEGLAHIAYVPTDRVVGFGRLSTLLSAFAHRLILQEDLAREVARALARQLKSPATACILEARQACLRLRGDSQSEAITHSEAYEGRLQNDRDLRRELWSRIPTSGKA